MEKIEKMEYQIIELNKLESFKIRGFRQNTIDKLTERIKDGYNPARPLYVHNIIYMVIGIVIILVFINGIL